MRLPNGYGGVTKLSGRRRKPYMVRKTIGWHIDEKTDKKVQDYVVIGYAATKSEALQMLADYKKIPLTCPLPRSHSRKHTSALLRRNFRQYRNPI